VAECLLLDEYHLAKYRKFYPNGKKVVIMMFVLFIKMFTTSYPFRMLVYENI
jgi:hypothetical protein